MNNVYDLIVVGAGPAGLVAAKTAAESGLSVALIERKESIHAVLRMCGQMIVSLSGRYMGERVVHNEKAGLLCFPHMVLISNMMVPPRIFIHGIYILRMKKKLFLVIMKQMKPRARKAGQARYMIRVGS